MFMNFSNLLLWEVYPSMVIHGQYIFISYDSAGRGSRGRSKGCCNIQDGALCDNSWRLKAINYYHKALHLGCCSSPRSASGKKESLTTSKFSSLFIMKSLLNVNLYAWSAFISHVAYLGKISKSWYKYSPPSLMPKILWYMHRISKVFKIQFFPMENINSLINS